MRYLAIFLLLILLFSVCCRGREAEPDSGIHCPGWEAGDCCCPLYEDGSSDDYCEGSTLYYCDDWEDMGTRLWRRSCLEPCDTPEGFEDCRWLE